MTEFIRSRAPLRIGIAGGGTDVEPYASKKGGCVFNTTINKYAYCTLRPRDDTMMNIESHYYGRYKSSLKNRPFKFNGNMDLIKAVTNHFEIDEGFDMTIQSDVPAGSGLGGSSTMIVAVLSAITNWLEMKLSKHEMAQLSYKLERIDIGQDGGKQDQYATVFGGFNYIDVNEDGVNVRPAELQKDVINELQCRSVLCFTKVTRKSADVIKSQKEAFSKGYNEAALDASKELARKIGRSLESGDIDEAAAGLDESWVYKKQFSEKISNKHIDKLYNIAKANGAIGGKVSGAGGGGFMYFICKHDKKPKVSEALKKAGAELTEFMFDPNGVTCWRSSDWS
jgi:D-glycero-alpha-D-manno-heptose-7-phosphate kinase